MTAICRAAVCAMEHGRDPIAVERLMNGHPPALVHELDVRQAVELLTRKGLTVAEISDRVGLVERVIQRRRSRLARLAKAS